MSGSPEDMISKYSPIGKERGAEMATVGKSRERAITAFLKANPSLEFKLTHHVFNRLRSRLGWSRREALSKFPRSLVRISLSEGIVERAKGGAFKIHLFGRGKFVIVQDSRTSEWVAVTFYPERW